MHWYRYYEEYLISKHNALVEPISIPSTGVRLHIDRYPQPGSPVVMINHGGGGYCKLFVSLALALHERGFEVIVPDQRGQGFSEGARGDLTLSQAVQNIVDVACWVERETGQAPSIAGGSVGGGLTYMAAAAGAPHRALICHNLYDFSRDALAVSRFHPLDRFPAVVNTSAAVLRALAGPLGGVRVPFRLLGDFSTMLDQRDAAATAHWQHDPIPMQTVTLRYIASLANTPPAVPYEANTSPVMVINPVRDEMVAPEVTRRNYERLAGPTRYEPIPWGHWSLQPAFTALWADLAMDWIANNPASAGSAARSPGRALSARERAAQTAAG